ncbi:T9SS type A sorting domain-containing protein, partial [candidate division WOR-3 bacterium]|nr:T9SS type A sorting domain-containing protein [candidate division WOR-3 bacterium]
KLPTIYRGKLLLNLIEASHIKIYGISGRLIYDSKKKVNKIDKDLSSGIYFVRINSNNKNKISKFIVIK